MSTNEFISAWNDAIPFSPISELDLKAPTELQFRRWLIAVLKVLFVDTTSYEMIEGETGVRARDLRVRLVATVQHFYKISFPNAKQDFVYMDLMAPAPKRVLNVLRSILNYNAYVQHTYNATIQNAKERLKERDELLMIRNQLRSEIESEKIKEGNISSHIKELEAKIPQQKTKIADLQEKEKALKSEINRNNEEREKCETKVSELISHLEELKASTISDEEVKSIEIAQQQIEEQRREQHEISNSARQKLVEDTCNIEKTTTLIKNLESILPNDRVDVKSFKTLNEEIQDLKSEINLLHQNHAKVQAELTSIKQHAKTKNKLYEDESKQLDEKQNHFKTILTQQKKEIKDKKNELKKLKTISANQRLTNARLRKEQTTLYQINQDLIKHISNQSKFTK